LATGEGDGRGKPQQRPTDVGGRPLENPRPQQCRAPNFHAPPLQHVVPPRVLDPFYTRSGPSDPNSPRTGRYQERAGRLSEGDEELPSAGSPRRKRAVVRAGARRSGDAPPLDHMRRVRSADVPSEPCHHEGGEPEGRARAPVIVSLGGPWVGTNTGGFVLPSRSSVRCARTSCPGAAARKPRSVDRWKSCSGR